jgi:ERCC4-type nuclease
MKIAVDHREERSGIPKLLEERHGMQVARENLRTGDYKIDNSIIFERKTLLDFTESIKDGRLFRQAERLVTGTMKPALILEGTAQDITPSGMSRESIQGALINLALIWGIPVLRSTGADETARLIVYAGKQIARIAGGGVKRAGYRPKTKRKRQLYILQGLPGIGPGRAERLLERYGSVAAVAQAAEGDLAELDGFGSKTAQKIYDAVHEERAVYGDQRSEVG